MKNFVSTRFSTCFNSTYLDIGVGVLLIFFVIYFFFIPNSLVEVENSEYFKRWESTTERLNVASFEVEEANPGNFGIHIYMCKDCNGRESYVVLSELDKLGSDFFSSYVWEYKLPPEDYKVIAGTIVDFENKKIYVPERSYESVYPINYFELLDEVTKRFLLLKEKESNAKRLHKADQVLINKEWEALF